MSCLVTKRGKPLCMRTAHKTTSWIHKIHIAFTKVDPSGLLQVTIFLRILHFGIMYQLYVLHSLKYGLAVKTLVVTVVWLS